MLEQSGCATADERDAFLQRALSICAPAKESLLLASCYLCNAIANAETRSAALASLVKTFARRGGLTRSFLAVLSAARKVPAASVVKAGGLLTAASGHEVLSKDLFPALSRSVKRNAEAGAPCLIAAFESLRVDASRYLLFLLDTCMFLVQQDAPEAEARLSHLLRAVIARCSDPEAVAAFADSLLRAMDAARPSPAVKRHVYQALAALLRALDARVMQRSDLQSCGRALLPLLLAAYRKEANAASRCCLMSALALAVQTAQQASAEVLALASEGVSLAGSAGLPALWLLSCVVALPEAALDAKALLPALDAAIQRAAAKPFLDGRGGILAMASVAEVAARAGCALPESARRAAEAGSFLFMHSLYATSSAEEREAAAWCQRSAAQLLARAMRTRLFEAAQETRMSQLLFDLVVAAQKGCEA